MSFALDCIKPNIVRVELDKSELEKTEPEETEERDCAENLKCLNERTKKRSLSTGRLAIPKTFYWSLKRDKRNRFPSVTSPETSPSKENKLTRVARPDLQLQYRKNVSLNIWIQEAKNIPPKRRYFCEVRLDGVVHARTTTKVMSDMLFWGEEFNLEDLDEVDTVSVLLWRAASDDHGAATPSASSSSSSTRSRKKRSHQQFVCQVGIESADIAARESREQWYPGSLQSHDNCGSGGSSGSSNWSGAMLRVRARYQCLEVQPLTAYERLSRQLLSANSGLGLLLELEPLLKVGAKAELALHLVTLLHSQGRAAAFLADLVVHEAAKAEDNNLILRGNTLASKAMEVYLKLVGEKYLHLTLADFVARVVTGRDDCEVDPLKQPQASSGQSSSSNEQSATGATTTTNNGHSISSSHCTDPSLLKQHRETLLMHVEMVWAKLLSSSLYFPRDLREVFVRLRERLSASGLCDSSVTSASQQKPLQEHHQELQQQQPDMCDRIVSACLFLRFLCPAILTPSLFGLSPDYPDDSRVSRTFTLVAKCIQTLANFSNLSGAKEGYMVFMNQFIEPNFTNMRHFLRQVSTPNDGGGSAIGASIITTATAVLGLGATGPSVTEGCLYWDTLSDTALQRDSIDPALSLASIQHQLQHLLAAIPPPKRTGRLQQLARTLDGLSRSGSGPEGRLPTHTSPPPPGPPGSASTASSSIWRRPPLTHQMETAPLIDADQVEGEWRHVLSMVTAATSTSNNSSGEEHNHLYSSFKQSVKRCKQQTNCRPLSHNISSPNDGQDDSSGLSQATMTSSLSMPSFRLATAGHPPATAGVQRQLSQQQQQHMDILMYEDVDLLADQTTTRLELERVRLLRRAVTRIPASGVGASTDELDSVLAYLDVAESVLTASHEQLQLADSECNHLRVRLARVLHTNQQLQHALVHRLQTASPPRPEAALV